MKYAEVCYTCVKFARDTQEQITHLCHLYYVVIKNIVNGDLDSKYLQALAANGGPFSLQAPNWHQLSNAEETVGTIFFDNRFLPTGDKNSRSH